ncbi:MAG: hypothetical protein ACRD3J_29345, partial [Thermoanaerobaculia bacterium]
MRPVAIACVVLIGVAVFPHVSNGSVCDYNTRPTTAHNPPDNGTGTPIIYCPGDGATVLGTSSFFFWDPDDERTFDRIGENWRLTANNDDATLPGGSAFPHAIVAATHLITTCIDDQGNVFTPPNGTTCALAGSAITDDVWADQDYNIPVLPDNGQTFFWQIQECTLTIGVNCHPWVDQYFINGPSAPPGPPMILAPHDGEVLDTPDVQILWRNADRARSHNFEARYDFGDTTYRLFSKYPLPALFTVLDDTQPPPSNDDLRLKNYPSPGVFLGGLASYRDGRGFHLAITPVNSLSNGANEDTVSISFRVIAEAAPAVVEPTSLGTQILE